MTIRFHPEGLWSVVNGPWAARRLRNRNALVVCNEPGCDGFSPDEAEGPVLTVLAIAKLHDAEHPTHDIVLEEECCRNGLGG